MTSLSKKETAVLDWIAGERRRDPRLIETLVNTDSGSYDKAGVDAAGGRIRAFLRARHRDRHGRQRTFGDAIRAGVGEGRRRQLPHPADGPSRHRVPQGEAAAPSVPRRRRRGSGPGCCDMKAGLAMNAIVLAAFKQFGGAPAPMVGAVYRRRGDRLAVLASADRAEARRARAVFNSEPGRPNGGVVTGRKGGAFMRIDVTGKAAHAGNNFADGISAIEEIARKISSCRRSPTASAG